MLVWGESHLTVSGWGLATPGGRGAGGARETNRRTEGGAGSWASADQESVFSHDVTRPGLPSVPGRQHCALSHNCRGAASWPVGKQGHAPPGAGFCPVLCIPRALVT